jgi:ribosomal protein L20A (L18A)
MQLAPTEEKMWEESPSRHRVKMSEIEINEKYESGEQRILIEMNREKLASCLALSKH